MLATGELSGWRRHQPRGGTDLASISRLAEALGLRRGAAGDAFHRHQQRDTAANREILSAAIRHHFPAGRYFAFSAGASVAVEDYFLVVSRLIPYKRIDLAVRAASELGVKLKVAGRGRDLQRLRGLAGETVEFLGYVPDDELPALMASCRAFLFPGLEDFGITTVQAQSAGRPVIAFAGGGALDTVVPDLSGEHFAEQTVASIKQIMASFDESAYDPESIRRHALQFDSSVFRQRISSYVEGAWRARQTGAEFRWKDPRAMIEDTKPWK